MDKHNKSVYFRSSEKCDALPDDFLVQWKPGIEFWSSVGAHLSEEYLELRNFATVTTAWRELPCPSVGTG